MWSSQVKTPENLLRLASTPTYLEGKGDLGSRLVMGIIGVTVWVIGVINLLTKSPDPPSRCQSRLSGQRSTSASNCIWLTQPFEIRLQGTMGFWIHQNPVSMGRQLRLMKVGLYIIVTLCYLSWHVMIDACEK